MKDEPCEVGPLARVLVAYSKGHKDIKPIVDQCPENPERSGRSAVLDARTHGCERH